ncbi:MAG: NAD-dependent epimerase/dehydratase family protein [Erythrobacter sp.]
MSVVALTGATGFVGSHVLEAALAAGHEVRALTRREQAPVGGVTWIRGTLGDQAALAELVTGADAAVHIAGLTNTHNPADFIPANVTGTANLIAVMQASAAGRLVFVSSLAARKPDLSAYGASKAEAEALVEASRLDWTTVRPPAVYGPRDVDMFELFRTAKAGIVPLPPGGATSIIHASDLAELLIALAAPSNGAAAARASKQIFEPDDGREGGWSHKDLAKAIGRAVGKGRIFAPNMPAGALRLAAKADRLLRGNGAKLTADRAAYMCHPNWVARSDRKVPPAIWQPRITGEEGLKATAQWYASEGWL